jgi:hypothetical protein
MEKVFVLSRVNVASQSWQHTMSDAQTNARWQMTPLNYFIQSSDWMAHDDRFAGMLGSLLWAFRSRQRTKQFIVFRNGPPL